MTSDAPVVSEFIAADGWDRPELWSGERAGFDLKLLSLDDDPATVVLFRLAVWLRYRLDW